jgi:hypothetical protein
LRGKLISIITDEIQPAGKYSVEFNGLQFPAGIYYYRFRAGEDVKCGKIVKL